MKSVYHFLVSCGPHQLVDFFSLIIAILPVEGVPHCDFGFCFFEN